MTEGWPIRTVVFDLDDTLFPEADYVRSGFRAAGRWLEGQEGVRGFAEAAERHFDAGLRRTIFDAALADVGLEPTAERVAQLVAVYRSHKPRLELEPEVSALLDGLASRFDLALLTDGYAAVQRRKIDALGLGHWFDCIVVTDELGREFWKPHPEGFRRVMASLPGGYVYIGDNPAKDFNAPRALGWRTVRMRRRGGEHESATAGPDAGADMEIDTLQKLLGILPRFSSSG